MDTQTLIDEIVAGRDEKFTEATSIAEKAKVESRSKLSETEQSRWDELMADIEADDTRVAELRSAIERSERAVEAAKRSGGDTRVRVISEPRTYSAERERRDGQSFYRDVVTGLLLQSDFEARERLTRHMAEERDLRAGLEGRDVGTGAFAGLTVPQYLTDMAAPLRRAGRPTADICNIHPLPAKGMSIVISRITTGSSALIQAAEHGAVTEVDMDDTVLTVNVRTIAGMQDVSRQAIDRGTGVDEIITTDLTRSYNTTLDNQILNADGTSGTHLGIRSTPGIVAVTYTDASPTAAELWPKLWDLVQQIQTGVFMGLTHFVMHPRRFWWLVSQVGTSFPFIQVYDQMNTVQAGQVAGTDTYENRPAGRLGPVPVILDANIPTNLGGGTNEDVLLGVTNYELHLWEDPDAPLFIRAEQVLANQLAVRLVAYGYSAFTAGRYPGAHGTISGTGFVTPTF